MLRSMSHLPAPIGTNHKLSQRLFIPHKTSAYLLSFHSTPSLSDNSTKLKLLNFFTIISDFLLYTLELSEVNQPPHYNGFPYIQTKVSRRRRVPCR